MDQADEYNEEQYESYPYDEQHIQPNSNQFTNCKELEREIIKILFGMSEKLYVDTQDRLDNTLNLMVHFSWAEDQIQKSGFFDNDEIKVKLYQNKVLFNYFVEVTQGQCQICLQIADLFQFGCQHFFCQNCYEQYILAKLEEQMGPILQCLQVNCQQSIPYQLIQILNEQTKNQYRISLCKSFLQNNQLYFCCSNPVCENILSRMSKTEEILCSKCYNESCRLCKGQSHYPLQCDQIQAWLQGINDPLFTKVHKILIKCWKCKKQMIYEKNEKHIVQCICSASICSGCGSIHYKYSECSLLLLEKYQLYYEDFKLQYLNGQIQINKQQQNNKDIIEITNLINQSQVNCVTQIAQQIIKQLTLVNNGLVFALFYLLQQKEKFEELLKILVSFNQDIQQQIIYLDEFKGICTNYLNLDQDEQLVQVQIISQFILIMKQQQEQILNTSYNNLYNVLNMLKIN
ncbi:hypothetical protein pb186bvf_007131 [Paramecium bursaria]